MKNNTTTIKTIEGMVCPVCSGQMRETVGNQVHPGDPKFGVGVLCPSWECPAQEVAGHGHNLASAYEVVLDKFKRSE